MCRQLPGILIACPYLDTGEGAGKIDWRLAWRVRVLAHTEHWDTAVTPVPEPQAQAVGGPVDAAVMQVTRELVSGRDVGEVVVIPGGSQAITVLRIGESTQLSVTEDLFCLGFPSGIQFGSTPTPSKGSFSGIMTDEVGKWIKFTGLISGGHSGGPTVRSDGTVIGWNIRNRLPANGVSGLCHLRPIEAAHPCLNAAYALEGGTML